MAHDKQLALCVFIDGLGWRLAERSGFLADVLTTRAPLQTVLGYSCACDPTILTGKLPQEHGHFSFFYYSPLHSPFGACRHLRWLPGRLANHPRFRRWLSRGLAWRHGYTGYFQTYETPLSALPYLAYSERKDIYQPGGILSGAPTVFDHLRSADARLAISDWRREESDNLARLEQQVGAGDIEFAYLYLAGLDGLLHADGVDAPSVTRHLRWLAKGVDRLLRLAAYRYSRVRLSVFSDHGMTDVTSVCDLMGRVERLNLRYGLDYAAVFDSTMARFWFFNRPAENRVRDLLAASPEGRVLSNEELESRGAWFPDSRYGELIFLLSPGVLLCPSYMGRKPVKGMHGYDPSHEDSTAFFGSNQALSDTPAHLTDLHDHMLREFVLCRQKPRLADNDERLETLAAAQREYEAHV